MASLHELKRETLKAKRRVGRGGKRGKTSGRGTKGQNARVSRKKRPEWRDIIKKLPKRRGFGKNRGRTVDNTRQDAVTISLGRLETAFDAGAEVSTKTLLERGVIRARSGAPVKIVGEGSLTKKLTVKGIPVSATARAAIEKVSGVIS